MTNRGAAVLGLRLLALMLLTVWLLQLPEYVSYLATSQTADGEASFTPFFIMAIVLPPLVAVLFWFGVRHVVDLVLPQRTAHQPDTRLGNFEAQVIAYSAVGLYLSFSALPELVRAGHVVYRLQVELVSPAAIDIRDWTELLAASLRLVLGVVLTFSAPGLARLVRVLRRMGTREARPISPPVREA